MTAMRRLRITVPTPVAQQFEFQATPHLYVHTVAVDTEGAADRGLATLIDRKFMEAVEVGWFSGTLGERISGVTCRHVAR